CCARTRPSQAITGSRGALLRPGIGQRFDDHESLRPGVIVSEREVDMRAVTRGDEPSQTLGRPADQLHGGLAGGKVDNPPGHRPHIHLTLTDDHPWAQAFVIIEALPDAGPEQGAA
ncbi:MAG: hypothetical protein AAGD12_09600, partial [Pseudomonadota bacterium]